MIIKEVKIESFAGIKEKHIFLDSGINVLYGENEAGKSSIQSFIKVMLFGMNSSRSKDIKQNERVKYKPFTGGSIKGEITIDHNNKEIVIRRTFGATKKDDICKVYYKDTGDDVPNIDLDEPGKSFLGISKNTYLKTLYIGQLGVSISKDKEDDLQERITNMLSSGDEGISINKALEKLLAIKKKLVTTRKTGELDNLKDKLLQLNEERYEAYQLSQRNIDKEALLIKLKEDRKLTRKEIENLEIYKKYLKRLKLQKEYEEITEYLKKSEELKKKERFIETELTTENGLINEEIINDIKDENAFYLRMLDMQSEENESYKNKLRILEEKKMSNKAFLELEKAYGDFNNKIKFSIERLKSIDKSLERFKDIKEKIFNLKNNIEEKRKSIGDAYKLKEHDKEVRELLSLYEYKLKELQYNASVISSGDRSKRVLGKLKRQRDIHRNLLIAATAVSVILNIIFNAKLFILIPSVLVTGFFAYLFIKDSIEINSRESNNGVKLYIHQIQDDIKEIEEKLLRFKEGLNVKSYEGFIQKLKLYDEYVNFEERNLAQIEELELMNSYEDYNGLQKEKEEINKFIRDGMKVLDVNTFDDFILKIDDYDRIKEELLRLEIQVKKDEESIMRINNELSIREERIREKLALIGLSDINLIELEDNLLKIKEKIIQKRDIQKALNSIEETYKVLVKDKDLTFIEEDLRGFISKDINYSYETQEEIDDEVRVLSNKLIDIEKQIKDIENDIKNRFIGKREISIIEEEIQEKKEEIVNKELLLKANDIALEALQKAKDEMRGSFGTKLNSKILEKFSAFTNNKYKETYLSETYGVMVKDENEIFTSELLSNGANDQLYLAIRLAFIDILFADKDVAIILDDAFVQYDDNRLKKVIDEIINMDYKQVIIFTCQSREQKVLIENNKAFNYILLTKREY